MSNLFNEIGLDVSKITHINFTNNETSVFQSGGFLGRSTFQNHKMK